MNKKRKTYLFTMMVSALKLYVFLYEQIPIELSNELTGHTVSLSLLTLLLIKRRAYVSLR